MTETESISETWNCSSVPWFSVSKPVPTRTPADSVPAEHSAVVCGSSHFLWWWTALCSPPASTGHSLLHIFVRHLCFRSVEGGGGGGGGGRGGGGGGGGGLNQVTDPGGRFFCQLQVSCGRLTGIFNYIYWWVQWGHSIHSYVSVILLQIHFHSQVDYIKGGLLN